MEGMYLETPKGGYDETIANIMNEGKMKALFERPRTRQEWNIFLGVHFKAVLGN